MRSNDPPIIIESAKCSAGCGRVYTKWCRQCNIVFCDEHVAREKHKCKPDEIRPYPSEQNLTKKQLKLFPKSSNGTPNPPESAPDRGVPENPGPSDGIPI